MNFGIWAVALLLLASMTSACVVAFPCPWCVYSKPDLGITNVGTTDDGTVHAGGQIYGQFQSRDGGLTWIERSDRTIGIEWGTESADTPRGRFVIDGPHILLVDSSNRSERVYSTAHLKDGSNIWAQKVQAGIRDATEVTTQPQRIVYDPASDNLIVAMGRLGVVVGTPDGRWDSFALGPYLPPDFSFAGKSRLLLSRYEFWAAILLLSISSVGTALVFSQNPAEDWRPRVFPSRRVMVAFGLWAAAVFVGLVLAPETVGVAGMYGLLLITLGLLCLTAVGIPPQDRERQWTGISISALAMTAACHLLTMFGSTAADHEFHPIQLFIVGVPGFIFGIKALRNSRHEECHWPAVGSALAGMIGLVVLAFMLWLLVDVTLALVKPLAVVLTGLVCYSLTRHLRGKYTPAEEDPPCPRCLSRNSVLAWNCFNCGSPLSRDANTC